jgi:hypothetical protein
MEVDRTNDTVCDIVAEFLSIQEFLRTNIVSPLTTPVNLSVNMNLISVSENKEVNRVRVS